MMFLSKEIKEKTIEFIKNKFEVQLIDLRDVSTVFSAQIVGNKEVLFCRDEKLCFEYDIKAFKNYIKLNEERQVVIEAIRRDGRING